MPTERLKSKLAVGDEPVGSHPAHRGAEKLEIAVEIGQRLAHQTAFHLALGRLSQAGEGAARRVPSPDEPDELVGDFRGRSSFSYDWYGFGFGIPVARGIFCHRFAITLPSACRTFATGLRALLADGGVLGEVVKGPPAVDDVPQPARNQDRYESRCCPLRESFRYTLGNETITTAQCLGLTEQPQARRRWVDAGEFGVVVEAVVEAAPAHSPCARSAS